MQFYEFLLFTCVAGRTNAFGILVAVISATCLRIKIFHFFQSRGRGAGFFVGRGRLHSIKVVKFTFSAAKRRMEATNRSQLAGGAES